MNDRDRELEAMKLLEAALAQPVRQRSEWLKTQPADRQVILRAQQLLATMESSDRRLATGAMYDFEETELPTRIGGYRVIRRLGQGGMGAVYEAQREKGDFDHRVAIKAIRPGILSPSLIERFEREREILARLVHPNIARLYDGGTSEDGRPFIIMEHIDGVPIIDWAAAKQLPLEARVGIMIRVCGAVEFAHQNLIIHRDLTPRNVLVTADGDPKLIDFGIARPQDEDEITFVPATDALSVTPGYAAPERFAGVSATTLTDIFSLGKMLAQLVEGFGPDSDLTAIVARASASKPEARYQSAGAMARDLERYLADLPVEARDGGRGYILGKFLKRQRFAVAAGSALIITLVTGLTASLVAFQSAREAQAEAELRFGEVRSLANTLIFDIYDSVNAVPGSTAAREQLAATAQQYLDTLASDPDAPIDVRLEAGRGLMRLAHVMGGVGGGNLGQRDEALANYERSDAILSKLHEEVPDHREAALALADLRYARSNTMVHITDDYERGLKFARSIDPIIARGCGKGGDCDYRRAQGILAEGQNLYWLERLDEAIEAFGKTIALVEGLPDEFRLAEITVRLEAQAYRMRGDARYYRDDANGAVADYETAVNLLKGAIARHGGKPDLDRDLAITLWALGGTLDEVDRVSEAIANLEQASKIMRSQVDADPDDAGSLRLLAVIEGQRGLTLSSARRFKEAMAAARASLMIRRQFSDSQPDQGGLFRDVVIQLNGLGEIHQRAGNSGQACSYFIEAIEKFETLDKQWGMVEFDRNDTFARAKKGARATC